MGLSRYRSIRTIEGLSLDNEPKTKIWSEAEAFLSTCHNPTLRQTIEDHVESLAQFDGAMSPTSA
jgi:hypothetical protein